MNQLRGDCCSSSLSSSTSVFFRVIKRRLMESGLGNFMLRLYHQMAQLRTWRPLDMPDRGIMVVWSDRVF